jgi:hypothetical protein
VFGCDVVFHDLTSWQPGFCLVDNIALNVHRSRFWSFSSFVVSFGNGNGANHAKAIVNLTLVLVGSRLGEFHRHRNGQGRGRNWIVVALLDTDQWVAAHGGNRDLGD